ncbi:YciI family protein [Shimia ponticola]|uniref:YciI family protein n=1 Tax=Shimia ponticola TaxID=2582893 RepID=UPI0011BEC731|nr:YciI family protein [Shimia ponticola]
MTTTFAVLFQENPATDKSVRTEVFPEHLAFLKENADRVRDAGTLFFGDTSRFGGMWIVEAQTRDEVEALVHADPFWPTGLRLSYDILEWRKVLEAGAPV